MNLNFDSFANIDNNVDISTRLHSILGNDFAGYIENNKPLVFTKENIDPYVCANGPDSCEYRVKQIYEIAGVPMEANGPSCDTVEECNDPTFGELA